jgi:hypothetical protein
LQSALGYTGVKDEDIPSADTGTMKIPSAKSTTHAIDIFMMSTTWNGFTLGVEWEEVVVVCLMWLSVYQGAGWGGATLAPYPKLRPINTRSYQLR